MGIHNARFTKSSTFFLFFLVQHDCLIVFISVERKILFEVTILPCSGKVYQVLHL
jgi:hypothetical protein